MVLSCLTTISFAKNAQKETVIPVIENAHVFAQFTDGTPAVLNYFTSAAVPEIIAFYQQHFGEVVYQETISDRLTVLFQKQQQSIRVVISQQNNQRQVDIIVK